MITDQDMRIYVTRALDGSIDHKGPGIVATIVATIVERFQAQYGTIDLDSLSPEAFWAAVQHVIREHEGHVHYTENTSRGYIVATLETMRVRPGGLRLLVEKATDQYTVYVLAAYMTTDELHTIADGMQLDMAPRPGRDVLVHAIVRERFNV